MILVNCEWGNDWGVDGMGGVGNCGAGEEGVGTGTAMQNGKWLY